MVKSQSTLGKEILNSEVAANPFEQKENVYNQHNDAKDSRHIFLESMFSALTVCVPLGIERGVCLYNM